MVASGSRTMIAGSLSGCIAGFRRSSRFSRLSGPRRWCVGIGLAFADIGGGSRARPQIETELRVLIRRMSVENPLWGAPRIHGELLKLGIEVAQSSVAKYMFKREDRQAKDGGPSCVITRRILPLWTCSLSRLSVSTC